MRSLPAIVFLCGCNGVAHTALSPASVNPPAAAPDLGVPEVAHDGGADFATGGTADTPRDTGDLASANVVDLATAVRADGGGDAGLNLCANQIDPGTHHSIILGGADALELFYLVPWTPTDNLPTRVRAVRTDGSAPPRTLVTFPPSDVADHDDLAIDDTDVFYTGGGAIWRVAKSGGTPTRLTAPHASGCSPFAITLTATTVFYVADAGCVPDDNRSTMGSVGKDGTAGAYGAFTISGIIGSDAMTFCFAPQGTAVSCIRGDGTRFSFDTGVPITALAVDGARVVVGGSDGNVRIGAADGTVAIAATAPASIVDVAARDGLAWVTAGNTLYRLAGGLTPLWISDPPQAPPGSIVVDEAAVYFQTICNIARVPR